MSSPLGESRYLLLRSLTFEYWTDPPDRDGALPVELSEDELHVEEGEGAQGEHHDVGDEEGAAAVLVAEVREPPHVGQVHREPDDAGGGK